MPAKLLIAVLAAATLGCMVLVLMGQYKSGSVYAEYSSRRTDRMGAAVVYEALSKVHPGVSRNELPLNTLDEKNAEIVILALSPSELDAHYIETLEALAKKGNRLVIGLDGSEMIVRLDRINEPIEAGWHLRIVDSRRKEDMEDGETRPRETFELAADKGSGWTSEATKAGRTVAVARNFGSGRILLMGGSWEFSNAALSEDRDTDMLKWAIGESPRILFDETHLGVVEQGSVMGLARRFRLQGVLAAALVCALLFIWRSSAPFPPERAASAEGDTRLAAASAGEGLRNLLAHHIPANRVVSACVAEWRKDRGRLIPLDQVALIENIAARKRDPVLQWREIRVVLGKKGAGEKADSTGHGNRDGVPKS